MDRAQITRLLLIACILYVIGFYFIGSAIKPGYSQLANFVSEYNATGTAWARTLTFGGFFATAILFSAFLLSARPLAQVSGISRLGFWLLWSLPASFLLGVLAPCDAGCPIEGSTSQQLHNLFGILVYLGMGVSVALLSLAINEAGHDVVLDHVGLAFYLWEISFLVLAISSWRALSASNSLQPNQLRGSA